MGNQIKSIKDAVNLSHRTPIDISLSKESFGEFRYFPDRLAEDLPSFLYRTPEGRSVRISLSENEIRQVAVRFTDGWWSTDRHEIIFKSHDEFSTKFPQTTFRWWAAEQGPEKAGKLNYAGYNHALGKYALFSYEGPGDVRHVQGHVVGDPVIPATLVGLENFRGRKLIWRLDAAAKAEEILSASRIGDFLLSVPVRTSSELKDSGPKILHGHKRVRVQL